MLNAFSGKHSRMIAMRLKWSGIRLPIDAKLCILMDLRDFLKSGELESLLGVQDGHREQN